MKNFLYLPTVILRFFYQLIIETVAFASRNLLITASFVSALMEEYITAILILILAFYCVIREVMEAVDEQTDLLKQIFKVKEED